LPNIDAWPIKPVFMRATGVLNEKFKTPVFHRCSSLFGAANEKANQKPRLEKKVRLLFHRFKIK
jgi:hypothetical protein